MHWAAIVFGWPAALTSIAVSGAGLLSQRAALVWIGAIIGLPFMYYLLGTPRFWPAAAAAVLTHFAAAVAVGLRWRLLAWLLFLPAPLLTSYVAAALTAGAR